MIVRRTQVIDLARSVPLGVILPLETSVFLTIAIKHFDAPGLAKGLIAAASGIGLLGSTVLTAAARRSSRRSMCDRVDGDRDRERSGSRSPPPDHCGCTWLG